MRQLESAVSAAGPDAIYVIDQLNRDAIILAPPQLIPIAEFMASVREHKANATDEDGWNERIFPAANELGRYV